MTSLAARISASAIGALRMKQRAFEPTKFKRPRKPGAHKPPPRWIGGGVTVRERSVDGWPVYTITPAKGTGGAYVYLHGGAYAATIRLPHWLFLAKLAKATGRTVTVPIYPLAPEHTHHDVFPTLTTVYRELAGPDVVLGGDSAGAGMALALAQSLPDDVAQPADLVLFSPWLDLSLTNPEIAAVDPRDPLLNPEHLRVIGVWYAGSDDPAHPRVSPIHGSLDGLGRITIFSGTRDVLHPDVLRFRAQARKNDADVTVHEYEGMIHDWFLLPMPETTDLLRKVTALLKRH